MSMYDTTDPRAALNAPAKSSVPPPTEYAAAEYAKFYQTKPQEEDKNGKTWYARGQNFIIAYTEAAPGATFPRKGQADEYVVLLHDAATTVDLTAGSEKKSIGGYTVTFVPPGDSTTTAGAVPLFFQPMHAMILPSLSRHMPSIPRSFACRLSRVLRWPATPCLSIGYAKSWHTSPRSTSPSAT